MLCALVYTGRNVIDVVPWLNRNGGDFEHFHRAARAIAAGQSPYSDVFPYPPLAAFLFLPLAPVPLLKARVLWFVFGHVLILASAFLVWIALGRERAAGIIILLLWSFGGTLPENLGLGQINPVILLLLCLALWLAGRRETVAATIIGIAAAIKLWPGLLLLAFRGRAFVTGAVAAAAGVLIPAAVIALALSPASVAQRGGLEYWAGTPSSMNMSLPALALRLTYPASYSGPPQWPLATHAGFHVESWRAAVSLLTAVLTLLSGLVLLWWRAGRDGHPEPAQTMAILCALTALATLASPIAWYHYQLMQFPAFALLASLAWKRRGWLQLSLLGVLFLCLTRSEVRDLIGGSGTAGRLLLVGAFIALANAILFLWLVAAVHSKAGTAA